jgi:beta-phosphoglucomutase-like phosphatase (HAD superfamily)
MVRFIVGFLLHSLMEPLTMLQRTENATFFQNPEMSDINPLMRFTCCIARLVQRIRHEKPDIPRCVWYAAIMTTENDTLLPHIPLIAFDLDGTLANTEALSIPSAVATLQQMGVPITIEAWHANLRGLSGELQLQAVKQHFGIDIDRTEYLRRRAEMVPIMFENGVEPAPGMLQALRNLVVGGQQVCICSNSTPARIAFTLEKITGQHSAGMNLPHLFEGHMYSASGADGSGKAKPAPDVYMNTAVRYKADATRCVAVEDSPVGVAAAVGAGFICVGYTGLGHGDKNDVVQALKDAGAHHILHHWDDFIPLLKSL